MCNICHIPWDRSPALQIQGLVLDWGFRERSGKDNYKPLETEERKRQEKKDIFSSKSVCQVTKTYLES